MNNEERPYMTSSSDEEKDIDLMLYFHRLWLGRKTLLKAFGVAILVGIIIALSIPRSYTVNVTLSPESGKAAGSGLSGMANMLGFGSLASVNGEIDALNVTLFPEIISSTPFILELLDAQVTDQKGKSASFYNYLDTERRPWWNLIIKLPGLAAKGVTQLFQDKANTEDDAKLDPFHLTKKQAKKVQLIREAISANVDTKTEVTTVSATFQDPVVTATLTDSIVNKLQAYITDYRISKAIDDTLYLSKLFHARQKEYYGAQRRYANYMDANKGVVLQTALTERERLQNEMNLAYQVYSQVATQLQVARAKVQEAKPVFAVVEPATVPLEPSGTSKTMILVLTIFLFITFTALWIMFGKEIWTRLKAETKQPAAPIPPTSQQL